MSPQLRRSHRIWRQRVGQRQDVNLRGQEQNGLVPTVHWSRYSYCGMMTKWGRCGDHRLDGTGSRAVTTPVVPHSPTKANPSKNRNARFKTNDAVGFSHNRLDRVHFFLIDFDCCALV
jgi:hypothetical protein